MPIVPQFQMALQILDNIIIICSPLMQGLTDYTGATLNPTPLMRSIYNETVTQNPEVVVSLRLGATPPMSGHNIMRQDDDNGVFECGVLARDSRVIFDIIARSPAERFLIADAIMSGIWSAQALDGYNYVQPDVLQGQMAGQGIVFRGFTEPIFDDFNPKEPRPTSSSFTGTVVMVSDIWISWTIPLWAGFTSFGIQTTATQDGNPPPGTQLWGAVANPLFTD